MVVWVDGEKESWELESGFLGKNIALAKGNAFFAKLRKDGAFHSDLTSLLWK